jgi:hypothetical protein
MASIKFVYDETIGAHALDPGRHRDVSLLLGDLNIVGNVKVGNPKCSYVTVNCREWAHYFHPASKSFFATSLIDGWDRSMPKALNATAETEKPVPGSVGPPWPMVDLDPGLTSPGRGSRLDYVAVSTARSKPCVQWMRLIGGGLSDHLAIAADINREAPYPATVSTPKMSTRCDPRRAYQPIVARKKDDPKDPGGWQDNAIKGRLKYAGSMEWYRFDSGGTWSFGVFEADTFSKPKKGVSFDVYEGTDLTEPIAQYADETTNVTVGQDKVTLRKFLVPKGPIFVRVYTDDRHATGGNYQLFVHQNRCTSAADACALQPNLITDPKLSRDLHFNADDTAWFELTTDAADSGLSQRLAFEATGQESPGGLCSGEFSGTLRVFGADAPSLLGSVSGSLARDSTLRLDVPSHFGPAKLFMTVTRATSSCGGVPPSRRSPCNGRRTSRSSTAFPTRVLAACSPKRRQADRAPTTST